MYTIYTAVTKYTLSLTKPKEPRVYWQPIQFQNKLQDALDAIESYRHYDPMAKYKVGFTNQREFRELGIKPKLKVS